MTSIAVVRKNGTNMKIVTDLIWNFKVFSAISSAFLTRRKEEQRQNKHYSQ
jgi:hypothetical protein